MAPSSTNARFCAVQRNRQHCDYIGALTAAPTCFSVRRRRIPTKRQDKWTGGRAIERTRRNACMWAARCLRRILRLPVVRTRRPHEGRGARSARRRRRRYHWRVTSSIRGPSWNEQARSVIRTPYDVRRGYGRRGVLARVALGRERRGRPGGRCLRGCGRECPAGLAQHTAMRRRSAAPLCG